MTFTCPNCRRERSLAAAWAIELPADNRSDEITLQALECPACGFRALGVYEESHRGALNSDCWNYIGYFASPAAVDYAIQLIRTCPQPTSPRCGCPSHRILGRQDAQAGWTGLDLFKVTGSFPLQNER